MTTATRLRWGTLAIVLVGVELPGIAHAGAWTQQDGGGYLKLSTRIVRADSFYNPEGNSIDVATLGDTAFSLYAEYGLFDRLTLVGNLPVRRLTLNRQEGELTGVELFPGDSSTTLGDGELGARIALARWGSSVFSTQVTVGIPVGDTDQENGLVTGDGEADVRAELLLGHSFSRVPIYVSASTGYAQRFEGFSNEFRYGLEAGYRFGDWGLLVLRANGIESLKNIETAVGAEIEANLFANNASFLAIGPEFSFAFGGGFGASIAAEGVVFGENVFDAPAFTFGLTWSR
ncbi:MAG: hypothetical protein AAFP04_02845 [Myxococcota bacterium]